jgi:uncharacterized protein
VILDFTIKNFRSIRDEQMLSMVAETGHSRHSGNLTRIEGGKLAVLRTAAVLGANASGKSNILKAMHALRWLVARSGGLDEEAEIPPYEPYKLVKNNQERPVELQIEFIVPSGSRYRYEVAFSRTKVLTEVLYSFGGKQRALMFLRSPDDTWETIKFGSNLKGGSRRISFFANNCYLSKAGNDASAPESIREIARYFRSLTVIDAGTQLQSAAFYENKVNLDVVSKILCLVDTGIENITAEENASLKDISFPAELPPEVREAFISANKFSFSFWTKSENGESISFDEDDVSDGTLRLFRILPVLLTSLTRGLPIFVDELDGHLHTSLVNLILEIYNDPETNSNGSQIVFTTHDTNILNSSRMRRDQVWLVSKENGASKLRAIDSFDKRFVRPDSPFEDFYLDGRLGALPKVDRAKIKEILSGFNKAKDT